MDEPAPDSSLGIGPLDILLGLLTLPLLLFALMFVTSQQANTLASRRARLRLYAVLLAVEAIIVAAIVWAVAG